jgi:hypothetical protein
VEGFVIVTGEADAGQRRLPGFNLFLPRLMVQIVGKTQV